VAIMAGLVGFKADPAANIQGTVARRRGSHLVEVTWFREAMLGDWELQDARKEALAGFQRAASTYVRDRPPHCSPAQERHRHKKLA
jgi:hypothetical protein